MIRIADDVETPVRMGGLRPEVLFVLLVAWPIFERHGSDVVVTAHGPEAAHSRGSLHYVWLAIDLRRWYLDDADAACQELQAALGPDYDVVLEKTHVHIEHQPKGPY